MREGRSVDAPLAAPEVLAVVAVGHAGSAAVGIDDLGQHLADPGHHVRQWGHVGGIVDVDQGAHVVGWQREAALLGRSARLVDDQVGRHRLLFQPFAGVAVVNAGRVCELGGGQWASVGESCVEAESSADVHAVHLERSGHALHEAFVQGDSHGDLLILRDRRVRVARASPSA